MKKLSILAVSFAAVVFASCGGNKSAQNVEETDSLKSFEQQQVEAAVKMQIDSLAAELGKLKQLPIIEKKADGSLSLTDQEKQVKPDYLLDPKMAEEAATLYEKYRVLGALSVDKEIAKLYDMPTDEFDKSIGKLAADINDPSFKALDDVTNVFEAPEVLYKAMEENGRINYYWQIVATSLIEQLFITTQNEQKFIGAFDDDAAANVTFRIILVQDALERLAKYDTELLPVAEAVKPLTVLNATTVDELKAQLAEAKEKIVESRKALLK